MLNKNKKFAFHVVLSVLGRFGTGFITLLLMPFYLPLLGKEAFGLFGVFMTIEFLFRIFEGGLVSAIVKDFSLKIEKNDNPLALLRSFEVAYIVLGLIQSLLCVILVLSGGVNFLEGKGMSPELIQSCLLIMAIRPFFSSLTLVHTAFIQAQEHIVALNIYRLVFSLLSSLGAILVLKITDGNPVAFFSWWVICTFIVGVLKMAHCWWGNYSKMLALKPDLAVLNSYKGDQLKLIGAGFLTFFATRYPMWIVTHKLDLATIGIFTLASQVSRTLGNSIAVMTKPLIARFARDEMRDKSGGIILLRMSQTMLMIAGFLVVSFYVLANDLITLWMKEREFDPKTVGVIAAYLLLAKFFILVMAPYVSALQADRNLKLIYLSRFMTIIIGIPLGYALSTEFGLFGIVASYAATLGLVFITTFPKMLRFYPVPGGALKKFVLPSGILFFSILILALLGISFSSGEPIVRILLVGTLSGSLFLGSYAIGAKLIKKAPYNRYV